MTLKYKYSILIIFSVLYLKSEGQSCCSGGIPLTGNLGIQGVEPKSWYFQLGYDYNFLNKLYNGSQKLDDNLRERLTQTVLLQAIYSFSEKFSVNGLFSYVNQKRTVFSPTGETNITGAGGLGDAVILVQFTPFSGLKRNLTIIYCPLTGTATAWDRNIDGKITTFGVSGLLYNTNIIPYDRATDSNWSQLFDKAIYGKMKGTKPKTYMVLETTWETWKKLYPGSKIMNFNTGYNRNYGKYPYGSYKDDSALIFPVKYLDTRLHAKERVHAVIVNGKARVYRFEEFTGE